MYIILIAMLTHRSFLALIHWKHSLNHWKLSTIDLQMIMLNPKDFSARSEHLRRPGTHTILQILRVTFLYLRRKKSTRQETDLLFPLFYYFVYYQIIVNQRSYYDQCFVILINKILLSGIHTARASNCLPSLLQRCGLIYAFLLLLLFK